MTMTMTGTAIDIIWFVDLLVNYALSYNRGHPLDALNHIADSCKIIVPRAIKRQVCEELVKRRNEVPWFIPRDLVQRECLEG